MKKTTSKLLAILVVLIMVFGTATSAFASASVEYNQKDGKRTSIKTITIAPYTYYNVGNDGKTDANESFLYNMTKKELLPSWGKLASAIFKDAGKFVTGYDYDDTYNGYDEDNKPKYDEEKGNIAATLSSPDAESHGSMGSTEGGVFRSTGLLSANSLKDVRNKVGSQVADMIGRNVSQSGVLKQGPGSNGTLSELDKDTEGKVYYNLITSIDHTSAFKYHYHTFGVAFYDFDLTILADEDLEYVTAAEGYEDVAAAAEAGAKGVKYQNGGITGTNAITYTENASGEPTEVSMSFENSKTTSLSTSIENSEEYNFEQMVGIETEFESGFGALTNVTQHLSFEFTFGQAYSETRTQEKCKEESTTNSVSTTVEIPANTAIGIQQEDSVTTIVLDYDTPVAISYKVAVFGMQGEVYSDDGLICTYDTADYTHSFFYTQFGGTTSKAGYAAYENLYNRAVNNPAAGFDASNGSYHRWRTEHTSGSTEEYTSEKGLDWSSIKSGGIVTADDISKLATRVPMLSSGSTMEIEGKSITSNIYGIEPLYHLKKVNLTSGSKSYDMTTSEKLYLDELSVEGVNKNGIAYYGFNENDGHWILCDSTGKKVSASPASIKTDSLTGEAVLTADEPGTAYIKWVLNDGVKYTAKNESGKITADSFFDDGGTAAKVSTAAVKLNITEAPFDGSVSLDGTYTGKVGDPAVNLAKVLTATVEDAEKNVISKPITWEAKPADGIELTAGGDVTFTKEGTYSVRAACSGQYSDWVSITAEPARALSEITFRLPSLKNAQKTLTAEHESLGFDLPSYVRYHDQYGDAWEGEKPDITFSVDEDAEGAVIDENGILTISEGGSFDVAASAEGYEISPITIDITDNRMYEAAISAGNLKNAKAELSEAEDIPRGGETTLTVKPNDRCEFLTAPAVTADNAKVGKAVKNEDGSYTYRISKVMGNTEIAVSGEALGIVADICISGEYTGIAMDPPENVDDILTVTIEDASGKQIIRDYTWEAKELEGISILKDGSVTFDKAGIYHIRAISESGIYSDWHEIEALPERALDSITFNRPEFTEDEITLTEENPELGFDLKSYIRVFDQYKEPWTGEVPEISFALAEESEDASITGNTLTIREAGSYTVEASAEGFEINSITIDVADKRAYAAELDTAALTGAAAELSKAEGITRNEQVEVTITPEKCMYFETLPEVTADNAQVVSVSAGDGRTVIAVLEKFRGNTVINVSGQTVEVPVSSISISGPAKVVAGQSISLKASVLPSDAFDKTVTWKSSNKKNAAVSKSGKVTAYRSGSVTVTAAADNGVKASRKVSVIKPVSIVTGKREGKGKISLKWISVKGADGYEIYGTQCFRDYRLMKTVKAGTTEATVTKVKGSRIGKKCYKFKVRAYKMVDGSKVYLADAKEAHVLMKTSGSRANAEKITITNGSSLSLKAGKSKTLKTKVTLPKKKNQVGHIAKVRYVTTDPSVAAVSRSGKVTARAKGECYIYAAAINGRYDRIKINVK